MQLNEKIFLFEQSKFRVESPSAGRPYYKSCTPGKLDKKAGEYLYYPENGDAELIKKLLAVAVPNCVYKTSKRPGYLRPGWFAIVPYLGNLGRGWALIEHEASSVVRYHFYLEGDYRGEI